MKTERRRPVEVERKRRLRTQEKGKYNFVRSSGVLRNTGRVSRRHCVQQIPMEQDGNLQQQKSRGRYGGEGKGGGLRLEPLHSEEATQSLGGLISSLRFVRCGVHNAIVRMSGARIVLHQERILRGIPRRVGEKKKRNITRDEEVTGKGDGQGKILESRQSC